MNNTYSFSGVPAAMGGRSFNLATKDGISGSLAFLESELEKLDPTLHEPLTSTTYSRDIDITVGGGWVDRTNALFVDYGIAGGSQKGRSNAKENVTRIIQANLSKDVYPVNPYSAIMRIDFIDMQRGNVTGRSLEQIYNEGIRLDFDKYMDINAYIGIPDLGNEGLVNNSAVTATSATYGDWENATADEILADINEAITAAWAASAYDNSAIPNHILVPAQQYALLVARIVSTAGNRSLLNYLLENNIARNKGVDLFIGECKFCENAGVGSTDRMVVYRKDKRFVELDLAQPLTRAMTAPNVEDHCFDSLYLANVGVTKIKYTQPIIYVDGI